MRRMCRMDLNWGRPKDSQNSLVRLSDRQILAKKDLTRLKQPSSDGAGGYIYIYKA